jgi:restriction endonuclease S subunit
MARGIKRSAEELIEETQKKIAAKQEEIKLLQAHLKTLEEQKKAELFDQVLEAATAKGVTVEDLLKSVIKSSK